MSIEDNLYKKTIEFAVNKMRERACEIEKLKCPAHHVSPAILNFNEATGNFDVKCCCDELRELVKNFQYQS